MSSVSVRGENTPDVGRTLLVLCWSPVLILTLRYQGELIAACPSSLQSSSCDDRWVDFTGDLSSCYNGKRSWRYSSVAVLFFSSLFLH